MEQEIKEEQKIKTIKFNHQEIKEELTRENIEDIIKGQENSIIEKESEIVRSEECIKHYKQYL